MDNNTNQNATPEIKTEEVEKKEKTKKVKEKKAKAPKEPKEPMDKQDQLCYLGAIFFFVLAVLPVLMRNFDPNYDEYRDDSDTPTTTPTTSVSQNLNCEKEVLQTGYSYIVEVRGNYVDDQPKKLIITYTLQLDPGSTYTFDTVEINEFEMLSGINDPGVTSNVDEPALIDGVDKKVYTITLNFEQYPNLTQNTMLDSHNKMIMIQRDNYQTDGYLCTTN